MFRAVSEIAAYTFQIQHCAATYSEISQKYTMPTINKLAVKFALTQNEAEANFLV